MEQEPLVSIVINNFNYGQFVSRAIESALNQTYSAIEVVVVDDGSTDDSLEVIAPYKSRIKAVFKDNGGQTSAFNVGYQISTGDIICSLDADDIFVPTKVAEIVALYTAHPEIGWCFHTQHLIDQTTGQTVGYSRESGSRFCDFRQSIRLGYLPFFPPANSSLSFRRSLLDQILPMPEELGNSMDRYLSFTAIKLSPGFFLDKVLTCQIVHGQNSATSAEGNSKYVIQRRARHAVAVAHCMRQRFPDMTPFCNRLFARGLGTTWWIGSNQHDHAFFVQEYLAQASPLEKLYIYLLALYQSRPWRQGYTYRQTL